MELWGAQEILRLIQCELTIRSASSPVRARAEQETSDRPWQKVVGLLGLLLLADGREEHLSSVLHSPFPF